MLKRNIVLQSLLVLVTFAIALYGKKTLNSIVEITFSSPTITVIYTYLWWIIPVIITVGVLFGFNNILKELKINRGLVIGFIFLVVLVYLF